MARRRRGVLQEVAHDVVAVDVHAEPVLLREQIVDQTLHLVRQAVLQQALQHPAAVLIPGHLARGFGPLARDLVDDELHGLGLHRGDAFLDDMVRVRARRGVPDVASELVCELHASGLRHRCLEGILHSAAAVVLPRETADVPLERHFRRLSRPSGAAAPSIVAHLTRRASMLLLLRPPNGCTAHAAAAARGRPPRAEGGRCSRCRGRADREGEGEGGRLHLHGHVGQDRIEGLAALGGGDHRRAGHRRRHVHPLGSARTSALRAPATTI
mmetsp:Transcript_76516/g.192566  ORF Transcript_76516/g.192566 Transcript_76516/m.192566 type:complete len:270 (-) Transcript_76516:35-844(-)